MLTRRAALVGAAACVGSFSLTGAALSQGRLNYWREGGTDPYSYALEPDEGLGIALKRFGVDEREQGFFLNEFAAGRLAEDEILEGQIFEAMVFGKAEVRHNIVAVPSAWRPGSPKTARSMFCNTPSGVIACMKPRVCGNWSRTLWRGRQPPCIPSSAIPRA